MAKPSELTLDESTMMVESDGVVRSDVSERGYGKGWAASGGSHRTPEHGDRGRLGAAKQGV